MKLISTSGNLGFFMGECDSPAPMSRLREIWLVIDQADECVRIIATASVLVTPCEDLRVWIDWLEVSDGFRRQGVATHLMKAIEQHYGPADVCCTAGTQEGEAFIAAYYGENDE